MRLSTEQIRHGLLHDDIEVRKVCYDYFTGVNCTDESILPVVAQVLDTFGHGAFGHLENLQLLVPSDAAVDWAIRKLREVRPLLEVEVDEDYEDNLLVAENCSEVLLNLPKDLLLRHRDDVLSVLDPVEQEIVHVHLDLMEKSTEELWNRLVEICNEGYEKSLEDEASGDDHDHDCGHDHDHDCQHDHDHDHDADSDDDDWDDDGLDEEDDLFPEVEVDYLLRTLAKRSDVPIDRAMDILEGDTEDPSPWMERALLRLVGLVRHEPAATLLIDRLYSDFQEVTFEAIDALILLGTDDVVRSLEAGFSIQTDEWRYCATDVLTRIHSDESIRALIEIMENALPEQLVTPTIALGLAEQFSTEGLEAIAEYFNSNADWYGDPEWYDVLTRTQVVASFMGVPLRGASSWEQKWDEEESGMLKELKGLESSFKRSQLFDDFDADDLEDDDDSDADDSVDDDLDVDPNRFGRPIVHETPRVGRNDPCPCGSGKKFKKCCMNAGE